MTNYTFGSFVINQNASGLGYFLLSKELPMPEVAPVTFPIARRDGPKKSGEHVKERNIAVTLKIVGSSLLDLLSRLDSLQQALSLRGQLLYIHDSGTRYYQNVDALNAPVKFSAGQGIVQCTVNIAFITYDPYAYSSSSSNYDTGTV